MYTLKIKWERWEDSEEVKDHRVLADESTYFLPAEEVTVGGLIVNPKEELIAWEEGTYLDYHVEGRSCRMVKVEHNGGTVWYLCSRAWLLNENGKTVERLA